jgi:hypothetical protein
MKDFIIYEKGTTKVYIHQGSKRSWRNNKWVKTKLYWYGIRRDDDTGYAALMGIISFDGGWRQYVTHFEPNTKWSSGCKKKICEFEDMINEKWRKSLIR